MKTLILGPTFVLRVAEPPEAVADRLGAWVAGSACEFPGHRQGLHLQLAVPPAKRHRWSPWLTIEVREPLATMPELPPTLTGAEPAGKDGGGGRTGAGEAEVFGRFNPNPAIWTGYVLVSLALITIGVGAAMWGVAQLMMEDRPTALWVIAACVLVFAAMWSISAAGQRLAADEMQAMKSAVEQALQAGEHHAG